jgi:uncharacterized protein (TIGR02246 family)
MDALDELLAIEAIKRLKARYMRAVDTKDWDALAQTFAPDARSLYSGGKYAYEGRDAIVGFLRGALADTRVATMHHAHTPEIEITSETAARGTWYLEDVVINEVASTADLPGGTVLHGTGIYRDEYVKQDGEWRIALTGYERIFEYIQPCHPDARLRTRWDRA